MDGGSPDLAHPKQEQIKNSVLTQLPYDANITHFATKKHTIDSIQWQCALLMEQPVPAENQLWMRNPSEPGFK